MNQNPQLAGPVGFVASDDSGDAILAQERSHPAVVHPSLAVAGDSTNWRTPTFQAQAVTGPTLPCPPPTVASSTTTTTITTAATSFRSTTKKTTKASAAQQMNSPGPQDELTSTVFGAIQALPQSRKANFLLDTALSLIEAGQYGPEVENYVEVYLRTPNLSKADIARALIARGKARKAASDRLLARANQDFLAVARIDPGNRDIQSLYRQDKLIHFASEPASQRAPAEVWERIAMHIPRYHLRTWLFVSSFHREIAVRHLFYTLDLYFGEDPENLNRGLDIFDRAKSDPIFASRVKSLRLHWAYEEGDMLDLMARIFRTALPEFKHLRDFEWIGYPEMRADMVQTVLSSHPNLHGLGLIGWHFDAVGVSGFRKLRKFTLRAEDDDGFADMGEVRKVLDENEGTLRHLILGAYLARHHSWDNAFQSVSIKNLTHLDLVDTRISHIVLARIAHAHNLQSLTLHGTFEEPSSASVVFGSDHVIDGKHTFLPHLEEFRFILVGHDEEAGLYYNVTQFLRKRKKLRKLDLGTCPWDLVQSVLPELTGLRALGVSVANLNQAGVQSLVDRVPKEMVAISLSARNSDAPMNEYAPYFSKFHNLSFLHLNCSTQHRPKPNLMSEKEFQVQTDLWSASAKYIALAVPSIDFVGWHGEHYVVIRHSGAGPWGTYGFSLAKTKAVMASPSPSNDSSASSSQAGRCVDCAAPMRPFIKPQQPSVSASPQTPIPQLPQPSPVHPQHNSPLHPQPIHSLPQTPLNTVQYPHPHPQYPHHHHHRHPSLPYSPFPPSYNSLLEEATSRLKVELKELPSRRRLDCGKGVDLGGSDAIWLERKDVPVDYEAPGLDE